MVIMAMKKLPGQKAETNSNSRRYFAKSGKLTKKAAKINKSQKAGEQCPRIARRV